MNIKHRILGNWLGDLAMFARGKYELLRAAAFRLESVGTVANDQLARVLVCSICSPSKAFLDVGAHIGSVVSAVRRIDPAIKIIAIEAIPEKAQRLRRKFPSIELHSCAVGEEDGETTFYVDTQQTGYSSLISPEELATTLHIREIRVAIRQLDNILPVDVEVDVMKIDIEGAELGALRGATEMLSRDRPVVMFESVRGKQTTRYETRDLFRFFDDHDYIIVVPNRLAHNDPGLTEEGFVESHLYPRRTSNYFAVHKDRRAEIRDRARKVLCTRTG